MPRAKYKLVFVGDMSVGKTSIISQFMYNHFDESYDATIGIDFLAKTHTVDNKTVRLQLWDTAGQERFRSLIPSYIRDSSVAVVVYDISRKESFRNCRDWIAEVRKERGEDVLIMLVGNKSDLPSNQREVDRRDGEEMAHDLNAQFIETSAKRGDNVRELFDKVCKSLPEKGPVSGGSSASKVKVASSKPSSGSSCC